MNDSSNNIFLSDGKMAEERSQGINVLSLFDGMSCGQIALDKLLKGLNTCTVYDLTGRQVLTGGTIAANQGQLNVDVSLLLRGTYLLELRDTRNLVEVMKIVRK